MIAVAEFAELRNEKPDTVSAYIRRNSKDFEGHLGKEKNRMTLDEEAVEILNRIYPLPKPIEVIEDTESRKALIIMQQKYIELQNEMQKATLALSEQSQQVLLLEAKEKDKDAEIDRQRTELAELREKMETEQNELRAKLEAEQQARLESEK